jgi:hypothetical protein
MSVEGSVAGTDSPIDRAEGFRYLSRLARAALETFVEFADPLAPVLHRPVHETAKIGADNPDNYYQHATISGQHEYRITGTRGTIHYLDFATQSSGVASSGSSRQGGHLDAADLEIGPDGRFEIWLSCEPKKTNWLRMTPDTTALIVRQTHLDREREEPAKLRIERMGGDGKPTPLTPEAPTRLRAAIRPRGGQRAVLGWAGLPETHRQLPRSTTDLDGAGERHRYYQATGSGAEEALVIEVKPPTCES